MKPDTPIWYPFTQMKLAPEPIPIVRGEGTLLYDNAGNTYIDAISSWWTNIHGHAHPYLAQKIFEQFSALEHVIFAGFSHGPAERIAQRLLDKLGSNFGKIFFSDNGSTSVEVALKIAIQYWKNAGQNRKKIIAFDHAYHGDTFGSMSVSEHGAFTAAFHEYLFDVVFIPPPLPGNETASIRALEQLTAGDDVAALIYEPLVMGAGGMLMYSPEYLERLLQIAKANHIICIADEVMTGFYRTGKLFASDHCSTRPDIVCLSKGLTGGSMAMGVTACAQYLFDMFYSDDKLKAFYHGHSYTANPLACAVANASLDLIENEGIDEKTEQIAMAHRQFASQLAKHKHAEQVRQTGTILAFDIVTDSTTNYFNTVRDTAYHYFISHGILLRPLGNTIYMMPPYCITTEELRKVYRVIEDFLLTLND